MKVKKVRPIRVGDHCRVVVPEFVVRVGYPMTVPAEADKVMAEQGQFLRETAVRLAGGYGSGTQLEKAVRAMAREIAYLRCKGNGWGGKERAIYRHTLEEWQGQTFHVQAVRFVKTGEYVPGTSWTGEYEPAYLANEKTHRLLELPYSPPADTPIPWLSFMEIEAANVVRIDPDGNTEERPCTE